MSTVGVDADKSGDGEPVLAKRRVSGTKRPLSSYSDESVEGAREGSLSKTTFFGTRQGGSSGITASNGAFDAALARRAPRAALGIRK